MTTQLNPYLSFRDNAKQAMEFYHSVFGGELTTSTFAEFQASDDPAMKDKIMHSMLTSSGGLVLMASDAPTPTDYTPGSNSSISLSGRQGRRGRTARLLGQALGRRHRDHAAGSRPVG